MLAEFVARLAAVLGSRVDAPLAGRVVARGATAPTGPNPSAFVGVDGYVPQVEFESVRPESVPGSDDPRRVVRLTVTVGIDVEPSPAADAADALATIDQLLYELDDLELVSGLALVAPGDQGFRISRMNIVESELLAGSPIQLEADGWFWPVGVAGQAGVAIEQALLRQIRMPVELRVDGALRAGAPASDLALLFGSAGTLVAENGAASSVDFGAIAVRLTDEAGGDGSGSIGGGADGPDGNRVVDVDENGALLTYTPPGSAGRDLLVVSTFASDTDGNERVGVELARFVLDIRP